MEIRTAAPRIPDHEVLRCIGKGSYGEVWLARAVTGTLRAVKVVRREDFELDRTFEREFEGIMKFEPVSREHPGLVHVLHVGRNDEEKFYYYVMELGDDRERGSRVDAADYEPRTMGTDRAMKHRLPVSDCIEHGAQVAEGLAHLHECGLTHRDIKPSNIIFVNGRAKLADIGLVAAAGQMTFVGTEGFVPPEGPGTKLADIYSLGMVLYELSTGKDRLQFPDLPDEMGDPRSRSQWQALNTIILKACASQPKKRFATAREMAQALRAAGRRKPKGEPWIGRLLTLPLVTAAAAFIIVTWQHNGAMPWPPGRFADKDGIAPPPPAPDGYVKIETEPPGAEVIYNGKSIGYTPTRATVPAGDASFLLRRSKYRETPLFVSGVEPGKESTPELITLRRDYPRPGKVWENSLGMVFDPTPDGHLSRQTITFDQFYLIQSMGDGAVLKEDDHYMIRIPVAEALTFCNSLTQKEKEGGWLMPDQCYRPEPYTPRNPALIKPGEICFRLAVEKYGTIRVESDPPGAEVWQAGQMLGVTPWMSERHPPGDIELRLLMAGYQETSVPQDPEDPTSPKPSGRLPSGGQLTLTAKLKKSPLAVFDKPWTNKLGMHFVPLSTNSLLIGAHEVRVRDYGIFAKATGTSIRSVHPGNAKEKGGPFTQGPDHPVVNITRAEAREFCDWLATEERRGGYIDGTMVYRLPDDSEWSLAAGLPNLNENRRTPAERHLSTTGIYPWVPPYQFPPPGGSSTAKAAGNLGDLTALKAGLLGNLEETRINGLEALGYDDGFPFTSPVARFASNNIGVHDLSGNAWEFIDDDYGGGASPERRSYAVVRGGAWNTPANDSEELATMFRKAIPPDSSENTVGFRVVLASLLPPPSTSVSTDPAATGPGTGSGPIVNPASGSSPGSSSSGSSYPSLPFQSPAPIPSSMPPPEDYEDPEAGEPEAD